MTISKWLDQKEAEGVDVSHLSIPDEMTRNEEPDETLYFKEVRPCSILCTRNHPFATVERYGKWYLARGRQKDRGPHTNKPPWSFITKDLDLAVKTARSMIEDMPKK